MSDSGSIASIFIVLFVLFMIALSIASTGFWIYALIDCATKEPDDGTSNKIVWLLLIVFTHFIGALLYFLIRRPQRIRMVGR